MGTHGLLYLPSADVEALMPRTGELVDLLRHVFALKAAGLTDMPPKLGLHPKSDAFIHSMPAAVPAMDAVGVKWISAYSGNNAIGLSQVNGLVVLNASETGVPIGILDAVPITAARTAAASVLAATYLARSDSETVGILGCGVQGQSHGRALLDSFPIRRVKLLDVSSDAVMRLGDELSLRADVRIDVPNSVRKLVEASDIVVSAGPITNPPHATIQAGWLRPGAFATSVDYASYWHVEALREMDILCTDDLEQLASHQKQGYVPSVPPISIDLAGLVAGSAIGRQRPDERAFVCNLGIALEDVAVAKIVLDRAREQGRGVVLPS